MEKNILSKRYNFLSWGWLCIETECINLQKISIMKLKMILFSLPIAALFFSCDGRNTGGSGESGDNELLSGNNEWDSSERNEFIKKARQTNLTEIRAGEIAQNKAQSAEVKQFGQTLVTDHRNANQQLERAVQQQGQQNQQNQQNSQNQQQPMSNELDDEHRNKIQKLQETSNQEFDKQFLDMMVKDHEKTISDFEDAKENADQQLSSYIDNTLPVLRKHLETAKRLQGQQNNR
jgi:putative membrane protein